jgi:hypothetical protein
MKNISSKINVMPESLFFLAYDLDKVIAVAIFIIDRKVC